GVAITVEVFFDRAARNVQHDGDGHRRVFAEKFDHFLLAVVFEQSEGLAIQCRNVFAARVLDRDVYDDLGGRKADRVGGNARHRLVGRKKDFFESLAHLRRDPVAISFKGGSELGQESRIFRLGGRFVADRASGSKLGFRPWVVSIEVEIRGMTDGSPTGDAHECDYKQYFRKSFD